MLEYNNKRVLVTGHTGFKGSWLVSWLVNIGADVAGISLPPEKGQPNLFEELDLASRIDSRIIDIREYNKLSEAIKDIQPEIVFHLAAQPLVRRSHIDPLETFSTNILGTAHLLEASRLTESVQAFVCVTTDKCYDNREWTWGYREIDPLGGKDPYSASKAAAEIVTGSYIQSLTTGTNMKIATARGGNVIGGGDWSKDRIVPDLVRAILTKKSLSLRNPDAIRPWQHVLELVRGYLKLGSLLLRNDKSAVGAWNFGPERENEISVTKLVEKLMTVWGKDEISIEILSSPIKEANFLKLDITKVTSEIGWRPVLKLEETADMTMTWYRDYAQKINSARELVERQIAEYRNLADLRSG